MTTRALVLAGGGIAGIAWETGVLCGIADATPETAAALLASDVLLGTSAGSAVAAQLAGGAALESLFERQVADTSPEIDPGVDLDDITASFLTAVTEPGDDRAKLRRIGAVAAATQTVPEPVRRAVIAARLPSHDWPDRTLRVTAIDVDTGELVVFDGPVGPRGPVALVDAVAASCAVPGAWPLVTIGGRRYMDGGVGSTVNLAAVAECDEVVALVPSARDAPSPFGPGAAGEIAAFAGRAHGVFADDAALAAFGANPLNPACRVPSAWAGREQGRRVAADVAAFLD